MNEAMPGIMPKLIAVTPEEASAARRIADRLRASGRVHCAHAKDAPAHLVVGVSLPLSDLYYLLTWLDHMAEA